VAVELTHIATLYHDDVMDEAPLRRGAPSAQTAWGTPAAPRRHRERSSGHDQH